jgi:hypothetical protein
MINIIHYDDDIFFLTYTVKRLADGLKLELDPSLFLKKYLEEIDFLSRYIEFFLESLQSTKLKINRINYLKSVYKLNKLFIEMLNKILTEQVPFSQNLKTQFSRLAGIKDSHIEHEQAIKDALNVGRSPSAQDNEALSEEEYRILLSPEEEKYTP